MKKSFFATILVTVFVFGLLVAQALADGCTKVEVPLKDGDGNEVGVVKLKAEECEYLEVEVELKDKEKTPPPAEDYVLSVCIDGTDTLEVVEPDDEWEGEVKFEWNLELDDPLPESIDVLVELKDADGNVVYTADASGDYAVPLDCCEEEEEIDEAPPKSSTTASSLGSHKVEVV